MEPSSSKSDFKRLDTKLNEVVHKVDLVISWIIKKFGKDPEFPSDLKNMLIELQVENSTTANEIIKEAVTSAGPSKIHELVEFKAEPSCSDCEEINDFDCDPLGSDSEHQGEIENNEIGATNFSGTGAAAAGVVTCVNCYISYTPTYGLVHKCSKPFKCPICSKPFCKPYKLKRHMPVHTKPPAPDNPYKCSQCIKSYSRSGSLRRHIEAHHHGHKYKCGICDKHFLASSSVRRHLKIIHNKELTNMRTSRYRVVNFAPVKNEDLNPDNMDIKPFPCTHPGGCPFTFPTQFRLQWHLKLAHKNVSVRRLKAATTASINKAKKYRFTQRQHTVSCTNCPESFKTLYEFRKHQENSLHCTPINSKQIYKCPYPPCQKICNQSHLLTRHIKRLHEANRTRSYPCTICFKSFFVPGHLKRHMDTVHTDLRPFVCSMCGKNYKSRESLTDHIKWTHEGVERPKSRSKRKQPNEPQNPKSFICEVCGREFKYSHQLKVHTVTHTREKPYECKTCGTRFTQLGSLKIHRRRMDHWDEIDETTLGPEVSGSQPQPTDVDVAIFLKSEQMESQTQTSQVFNTFKCPDCPKAFKQRNHLEGHRMSHSIQAPTNNSKHICYICGGNFSQGSSLARHLKTVHKDVYNVQK